MVSLCVYSARSGGGGLTVAQHKEFQAKKLEQLAAEAVGHAGNRPAPGAWKTSMVSVVMAWLAVLTVTALVCAQDGVKPLMSEELKVRHAYAFGLLSSDGSFDAFFTGHFAGRLATLRLETPTVIELKNPYLPSWVSCGRKELWFDPAKPQQLRGRPCAIAAKANNPVIVHTMHLQVLDTLF